MVKVMTRANRVMFRQNMKIQRNMKNEKTDRKDDEDISRSEVVYEGARD